MIKRKISITNFFLIIILLLIISVLYMQNNDIIKETNVFTEKINIYKNTNKQIINLEANKFIVYNLNSHTKIRAKNEYDLAPLASISKVITVATFLKTFKENNLNLNDEKFIETRAKILKGLIQSDNENTEELQTTYEQLFNKNLLNDIKLFLESLNIKNYKFNNLTGLDIEVNVKDNLTYEASNELSLNDLVKVFEYIYKEMPEIFEYTKFNSIKIDDQNNIAINTNQNVNSTYGLLISKTGYTDAAGGNLATIINYAPNETYLIIVLQSTKEGRFSDLQKIISVLSKL